MASMGKKTPGKDGKMIMDKTWEKVQQKTFTKWVNSHLRKRGKDACIEDVQTDFSDGVKLIQFLEVISTKNDWSRRYDKKPRMKIQKIQNVDMCMKFLKSEGVKLVAIQAENIVDGDLTLILGMIWTIIQQYQIADISEEELTAKEALLLWCQKKTKNYEGVDPPGIKNFHTNWADGLALCALIHRHRPDLLDYNKQCSKSTPRENCELAFKVAEDKLGIPQLLDVEDLVDTAKPDERSVITYVVQYYHVFAASQKGEVAGRRVGKLVDFQRQVERLKNEYNDRAGALRQWIETKLDWLKDREFGETEDEIAQKLAEYNAYRQSEKPEKAAEKSGVEALFNSIQVKLSSNDRPAFVPSDGLQPREINELWAKLLEAEREREAALRGARKRERELAQLTARLDDKSARLQRWIEKSEAYLARDEPVESVNQAQSKLLELEAWRGEYSDTKPRVDELKSIAEQIAALNGPTADDAKQRADELAGRYDALGGAADQKKAKLDDALAREQQKEKARQAWAKIAKGYVRWTKSACETADDDRYFGDSVAKVNKAKERIDGDDGKTTGTNGEKKAKVDEAWAKLQELGVTENKYSSLTQADTNAASANVDAALKARQEAWAEALAAEEAKEAKRKEFADAAQAFVDSLGARRGALVDAAKQGEPDAAIGKLDEVYAGGAAEQAELGKLAALQDECAALGITSNKHTNENLASLQAKAGQLGRFVDNKKSALTEEAGLKRDYDERARALVSWRAEAQPKIEARDVANTLDDARAKLAEFQTYRTNEKASKSNEKLAVAKLAAQIDSLCAKNERPAFAPADDISQAAIDAAFAELDQAETAKAEFVAQYLQRQEELDQLIKRFNADEADVGAWLDAKEAYVGEAVEIDSLQKAQHARVVHQSFSEEYANRADRLAALQGLAGEIANLDYGDKDAIQAKADAAQARYDALKAKADAKSEAIEAGLKAEQEKEDARIAFASAAKDLDRYATEAVQAIGDRTFGFTLSAVEAHAAELEKSDAQYTADTDAKHGAVKEADGKCSSLSVGENPHTKLTVADADASRQAVLDALKARRTDYDAELAKQKRWDEARRAFAGDADAFVAWLEEQRKAVVGVSGEPDERIAAIKAIHQDGAPGKAKVAELSDKAQAMRDDGIVGNEHTGLTVPLLEKRNAQFDKFVATALANIEDEKVQAAKDAEHAAAAAAAEQKEQEQFEFQKAAKLLLNWLASAGAFLTEPISCASLEDVAELKKELDDFNGELAGKQPDYDELQSKAASVSDNSLMADVTAKWDEAKELAAKRAADLDAEQGTQAEHEKLRKAFADDASAMHKWIDGQKAKLAGTSGDLEAQQAALADLAQENAEGEAMAENVQKQQVALDDAGVSDNPHTNLTADQLQREYKGLVDATADKQKLVDEELAKKSDSGVTPAQLAEWREVFSHFDKDHSQSLQNYELKACLNSLGDDPSDEELKAIEDKYKDESGKFTFDGFQQMMLDRNTDKDTEDAIMESWRVLANDKDHVLETDMQAAGMEPDHVKFLTENMPKKGDGYDYEAWTKAAYA